MCSLFAQFFVILIREATRQTLLINNYKLPLFLISF